MEPPAAPTYDRIGDGYARRRRPDPRLAAALDEALGPAEVVVNVGAGTGSYEPADRRVVAVEPSAVMIAQRAPGLGPAVRAAAEALPVRSGGADAVMALSTVHHWTDRAAGLAEMARVAPRRVLYFSEPVRLGDHWLVDDYLPELVTMGLNRRAPTAAEVAAELGGRTEVRVFPVPADFRESSAGAFWSRPEALLDPEVRAGLSIFRLLEPDVVQRAVDRLTVDLARGLWDERHGHLRHEAERDMGYRIVVSTA